MTDFCRTCKAPVLWAITDNGRLMPVDTRPSPHGNLALSVRDGATFAAVVAEEDRARPGAGELYVSHFATCPYADQHRR